MASAEVEETIRRLSSHKGVEGIVISTYEGVALRSTLSAELTTRYAGLMTQLVLRARGAVRTIDAEVSWLQARGSGARGHGRGHCLGARSVFHGFFFTSSHHASPLLFSDATARGAE